MLRYLRARYYDPSSGQFISRDPAAARTREPYAYVSDNPLNMTDPTGLFGWDDVKHAVGSAFAVAADATGYMHEHLVTGLTVCVFPCGQMSYQAGHYQFSGGGIGGYGRAAYLGYAPKVAAQRHHQHQLGIGAAWGGGCQFSVGADLTENGWKVDWSDWEFDLEPGVGAFAGDMITHPQLGGEAAPFG